jgi:hypothetical protein
MDLKKVKALLAEYYEGRTSREDEACLKDFFSKEKVPSEMEADRQLFLSLMESEEEILPDPQFDEKLFAAIGEQDRKNYGLNKGEISIKSPARRMVIAVSGIAAGIAILIGSYFMLIEQQVQDNLLAGEEYTIEETMLAYEEARNALVLVSQVMNRGTEKLEPLSKMEEATRELRMINKFHQGTSELQALSRLDEAVTSPGRNY